MTRKTVLRYAVVVALVLLVAIQFIQPDRTNPVSSPDKSFAAVAKPNPEVAAIIERSCRDCHTNDTVWPWYSRVAPVSWLVASDVKDGRAHVNFSEWSYYSPDMSRLRLKEVCNEAKAGEMPIWFYTLMHPRTKLSQEDVRALCAAAGQ